MVTVQTAKKDYISAVGRRKEAVARVRLFSGKGNSIVNNKPVDEYFPGNIASELLATPFKVAKSEGVYWYSAKVEGGGKNAQIVAVILGIARALVQANKEIFQTPLKKHGLLTRDPRMRERRKVDTGGKARRQKKHPRR